MVSLRRVLLSRVRPDLNLVPLTEGAGYSTGDREVGSGMPFNDGTGQLVFLERDQKVTTILRCVLALRAQRNAGPASWAIRATYKAKGPSECAAGT